MTTKEKAKAYDEAIERAKKFHTPDSNNSNLKAVLELIFPELRESEDERMRKGLIEALKTSKTVGELKFILPEPTREECIAYLEKQKEQKPIDIDYISGIRRELLSIENNAKDIDGLTEQQWVAIRAAHRLLGEYVEQEQKPAEWSEEDENMLNSCISSIEEAKENRYYYRETDGDTSYDHEISWLKSLRPQPKQNWSKEDEEALERAINCVRTWEIDYCDGDNEISERLKSLRLQLKQ